MFHQGRAAMVTLGRALWAQRGCRLPAWQLPVSPVLHTAGTEVGLSWGLAVWPQGCPAEWGCCLMAQLISSPLGCQWACD